MAMTCYGKSPGHLHISPGGGFFASGGLCMNAPVDAPSYPGEDRLYIYANINYSRPNIRTIRAGYADRVYDFSSSDDYCWVWWEWGGYYGDTTFELRDGSSVKATRSTYIERDSTVGCQEGDTRYPETCPDGSTIHGEVCNQWSTWITSDEICPVEDPLCKGVICENKCVGYDLYSTKCSGGVCVTGSRIDRNAAECGYVYDPCRHVKCGVSFGNIEVVDKNLSLTISVSNKTFISKGDDLTVVFYANGTEITRYDIHYLKYRDVHKQEVSFGADYGSVNITADVYCGNSVKCTTSNTIDITGDLCEGVVCNPECYGYDTYSTVCVDGTCVQESLMEANSPYCGYVPPDPCEGVVCEPECHGYDLYDMVCSEGLCTRGNILETNSQLCGYVPPEDPDDPIPDLPDYDELVDIIIENKEFVAAGIIAGIVIIS